MFKLLKTVFSSTKPIAGTAIDQQEKSRACLTRQEMSALFVSELGYASRASAVRVNA